MLVLGSRLLRSPIMSLQTGTRLATAVRPLIDPSNLRIIAYEVEGDLLVEKPSFIRTDEIREYGHLGMIIDSNDELIGLNDVIQVKKVYDLRFSLIGLHVIDENRRKLGKVEDYTLETGNFLIQQLSVRRGFLQGITDAGFLVNRTQIIEINNTAVIIKSPTVKSSEPVMKTIRGEFINPFRSSAPQSQSKITGDS